MSETFEGDQLHGDELPADATPLPEQGEFESIFPFKAMPQTIFGTIVVKWDDVWPFLGALRSAHTRDMEAAGKRIAELEKDKCSGPDCGKPSKDLYELFQEYFNARFYFRGDDMRELDNPLVEEVAARENLLKSRVANLEAKNAQLQADKAELVNWIERRLRNREFPYCVAPAENVEAKMLIEKLKEKNNG